MNELTVLSTDSHLKDEEPCFTAQFINYRDTWVRVYEFGNKLLFELAPGGEFFTEAWDPGTSYAPFDKIEFKEGGKVDYELNKNWACPTDKWHLYVVEFINLDGAEVEGVYVHGSTETPTPCYLGIPRFVAVTLDSVYVRYKKVEFRTVREKVPSKRDSAYLVEVSRLDQVKTERSKVELDEIESALKARAKEEVERGLRRSGSHPGTSALSSGGTRSW